MKILLVGEFSGLHQNLKYGLQELGCDVTVAAYMDGFKKIPADINLDSNRKGLFRLIEKFCKPIINLRKLGGYDVVQFISANYFWDRFKYNEFIYKKLIRNNAKSFFLAAGCDSFFWKYGPERLKYSPFEETLKYDYKSEKSFHQKQSRLKWNEWIANRVDGIIPIMYEYQQAYSHVENIRQCIPLPINADKIPYTDNIPSGKIKIFHGLNRYGFKGTRYVEEAFDILKKKYPNDLELVIRGNMPLHEYLNVMSDSNVVIDQVLSHSCGMNGLFALAMGKVVLGGAEPESFVALDVKPSPVINLKPDTKHIVSTIENLLERRSEIQDLGRKSRLYVEDIHNHIKIADKYIKTWNE